MRGSIVGTCLILVVLGAASCSSGPTRAEFVDQLMKVNVTPNLSADQAEKLRNIWACVYDHLDDDSIEGRVMKLQKGERLATEDSASLSKIITNQCKAEMEAGTKSDTSVPGTSVPDTSVPDTSLPGTSVAPAVSVP